MVLKFKDEEHCLVEFSVLLSFVIDDRKLTSHSSRKVAKKVNRVVKRVASDDLVAARCLSEVGVVPSAPLPRKQIENLRCHLALELTFCHCRKLVERAVNDK